VNVSTANTAFVGPGIAAYAASKAALELASRVAACELGGRGITVNSVLPGATDTEMFRKNNPAKEARDKVIAMTPLQRIGEPEDIADVVVFLVSEDARWLTGQSVRATGVWHNSSCSRHRAQVSCDRLGIFAHSNFVQGDPGQPR